MQQNRISQANIQQIKSRVEAQRDDIITSGEFAQRAQEIADQEGRSIEQVLSDWLTWANSPEVTGSVIMGAIHGMFDVPGQKSLAQRMQEMLDSKSDKDSDDI